MHDIYLFPFSQAAGLGIHHTLRYCTLSFVFDISAKKRFSLTSSSSRSRQRVGERKRKKREDEAPTDHRVVCSCLAGVRTWMRFSIIIYHDIRTLDRPDTIDDCHRDLTTNSSNTNADSQSFNNHKRIGWFNHAHARLSRLHPFYLNHQFLPSNLHGLPRNRGPCVHRTHLPSTNRRSHSLARMHNHLGRCHDLQFLCWRF